MLNNPLVWWSFVAICLYASDCIIKFAPPLRKWHVSEEGSTPPRLAIILQNLSLLCPLIIIALASIVSTFWLFNEEQLFPTAPVSNFWLAVIFIAGVVSFTKHMIQHATLKNAKLLTKYFDEEMLIRTQEKSQEEINKWNHAIKSDESAGFYSEKFHKWHKEAVTAECILTRMIEEKNKN